MSTCMYNRQVLIVVFAGVLLSPFTVLAQSEREQELERRLRERDAVILELLERVEALERRVGIQHEGTRGTTDTAAKPESRIVIESMKVLEKQKNKAPGSIVVEEGAAERALERALSRQGAVLLSSGIVEIEPGLSYSRNESFSPFLFTSDERFFAGSTDRRSDTVTALLSMRLGLPWDSQLELGLPYRWRQIEEVDTFNFSPTDTSTNSGAGLGDLRVGLAKTILREGVTRPDLIARLTWDTDTGDIFDDGIALGGGFHELRGSLTAIKREDPIAIVASLGYEHTFEEDNIEPGDAIFATFGSFIALSPETSISFVLSGSYREESELSGVTIDGSDQLPVSLFVGGSTLLARGTLLNISTGIGLTDDADDFSLTVSLPFRFNSPLF